MGSVSESSGDANPPKWHVAQSKWPTGPTRCAVSILEIRMLKLRRVK